MKVPTNAAIRGLWTGAFLVGLGLFASPSLSQAQRYVGIRNAEIEHVVSSQRDPQWCWAACVQMVLNYYGLGVAQEDIVYRTFGTSSRGRLPSLGASAEVITQNLNNWGIDRNGRRYLVTARVYRGSPDAATIIGHLAAKKPIVMAYGPSATTGHVVLVTEVSYQTDFWGKLHIGTIVVRDPYPDSYNVRHRGHREYANGRLPAPVQWTWLVEVH